MAGRQQVASGPGQEEVVLRIAAAFDEISRSLQHRQVMPDRIRVASREQQFRLHHHAGGRELHAPIVDVHSAVTLLGNRPARPGGIAQAAVRWDPREIVERSRRLAVAHLIEPQVLGILQEAKERFLQERQCAVGRPIAVLDPPCVPGGALDQAVPGGHIEHSHVLELGIGLEHPPGDVEQLQVLRVAFAAVELPCEMFRTQNHCRRDRDRQAEEAGDPCSHRRSRKGGIIIHRMGSIFNCRLTLACHRANRNREHTARQLAGNRLPGPRLTG